MAMRRSMDYDRGFMKEPVSAIAALFLCALAAGCATDVHTTLVEAQKGDPESVREAVVELGVLLSEKERGGYTYDEGDRAAISYLREVATNSNDALNRANAIDSLRRLKRPQLADLYLAGLKDSSWVVQIEAVKALKEKGDAAGIAPLSERLEDDIRLEVRVEILKAIATIGGAQPLDTIGRTQALETLLFVFLDSSERYENMKLAAYDGVRSLSDENFAFQDKASWAAYQDKKFPEPAQAEAPAKISRPLPGVLPGPSSVESEPAEERE